MLTGGASLGIQARRNQLAKLSIGLKPDVGSLVYPSEIVNICFKTENIEKLSVFSSVLAHSNLEGTLRKCFRWRYNKALESEGHLGKRSKCHP